MQLAARAWRRADEAVSIPGGEALIGTASPLIAEDGEGPLRRKRIGSFRICKTAVTNAQFADFIADTGYVTEAETIGWSFVFFDQVPERLPATEGINSMQWWRRVDGAFWRDPAGSGEDAASGRPDDPAVQVSWNDARAYAAYSGGRLPTEAEWEHAARGGLEDVRYPWGDREPDDASFFPCNIWQGRFPDLNLGLDGHRAWAPTRSFEPNGYGLYHMVGNVWEWTADAFVIRSLRKSARSRQRVARGHRLLKGGSYLCHRSYCHRYRIAARSGNSPDTATTHQGFRVVFDPLD